MEEDERIPRDARVCWILIDGVGDMSVPSLGRRTALQKANIPACDTIASMGVTGLMDPVQAGQCV
jgi:2,3-bisphosphoglycerate-independent phosphoglycerate mutase